MKYRLSPAGRKGIDDYCYDLDIKNYLLNNDFDAELDNPRIGTPDFKITVSGNRIVRLALFDVMTVETLPEDLFTL